MAAGGGIGVGGTVGGYGDRTSITGGDKFGIKRDCRVARAFSAARVEVNDFAEMLNDAIKLTFVQKLEFDGSGDVIICVIAYGFGSKRTTVDKGHSDVLLCDIMREICDIQEWLAEVRMCMGRELDWLWIVKRIHGKRRDVSVLERERRERQR